jgi:hypothetical protein
MVLLYYLFDPLVFVCAPESIALEKESQWLDLHKDCHHHSLVDEQAKSVEGHFISKCALNQISVL